jgi:hypothetical protein
MAATGFADIDQYQLFLERQVERWSPAHRAALAAAMGERWLHVYREFSENEDWGDVSSLRQGIDAAWARALGRATGSSEKRRIDTQLDESTPHQDDFEAPEALAAAAIVKYAVDCAEERPSAVSAVWCVLSAYEAVSPECLSFPDEDPNFWKKAAVKKELQKQLALVETIGSMAGFDQGSIDRLRARVVERDLKGELPPRRSPAKPAGTSNQTLFEQYRGLVEPSLRTPFYAPPADSDESLIAMISINAWSHRYSPRKSIFEGSHGKPADAIGHETLLNRNRARDAAFVGAGLWNDEVDWSIRQFYANPYSGPEVQSADAPHQYGPSLRRLLLEAARSGRTGPQAWSSIAEWSHHAPAAWAAEDRRKKQGLAYNAPDAASQMAQPVAWFRTDDADLPWQASVDGVSWAIRLNDFPDDYMYTLIVDGKPLLDFHDWPEAWQRA